MITAQAMKIIAVLKLLFLSLVVPPINPQRGLCSGGIPISVVVEGLDVAKTSSRPRSRIWTVARPQAMIQPQNPFRHISPIYTPLKSKATEWHGRRHLTRLCNKNSDDDDGSNSDSGGTNEGKITDENSQIDQTVTTDQATALMTDRRRDNIISEFLYGANYVHSQYLSILWRYSILRSFAVTVPIGIALWIDQQHGLYNSLFRVLRSVLAISSVAARLLQLPLEFAQSLLLNVWNVSPEAVAAAINFLPNAAAIPLVQLLLSVRTAVMMVVDACCGNNAITFLSSMVAILVWRPAVEEWQYRSVLNKLLFGAPRWMMARGLELSPLTTAMVQRIAVIGANLIAMIGVGNNATLSSSEPFSSSVETVGDLSLLNRSNVIHENNGSSTSITNITQEEDMGAPFLPDESTRILLGSILFATTRLGWLASDPADSVALSNSPYGFTIGFLQSIGSLVSSGGDNSVVRHDLRIFILLLAIHQTVSTFFVAQHVFAGIYRRRGLVASVGAHVSWTVGKGTIVLRLLWKFLQSTSAVIWSTSYVGSPDTAAVEVVGGDNDDDDDDSNPSRGDDKDDE